DIPSKFGGDHDLATERLERFPHELFVGKGAVDLGRVEERDPSVHRRPDQRDPFTLIHRRPRAKTHPHSTKAQGPTPQAAFSQFAFLHVVSPRYVKAVQTGRTPAS